MQGLKVMMRSRTARRKTEWSMTWFFWMVTGEIPPSPATLVTHAWTVDGMICFIGRAPKNGRKWWFKI